VRSLGFTHVGTYALRPLFGCSAFKFRTKTSSGGYLELGSHAARNRPNASAGPVFPRTGRSHPLCGPPIPGYKASYFGMILPGVEIPTGSMAVNSPSIVWTPGAEMSCSSQAACSVPTA
jgi:hypothetical protein